MSEAATLDIRSAIDEITLQVAHPGTNDLATEIEEQAIAYMARVLLCWQLTDDEIERIIDVVVKGVLKRLEQIAIAGGQIGSA